MRVFPAGARPVVIHAATVVREKKWAWRRDQNVIIVIIDTKVLFNEGGRTNPEVPGQAFDVALVKYRAGSLATVRTLQAIGGRKNLVVKTVHGCVELPRIRFLQRA